MKNKWTSLLLAASLTLSLTACGGNSGTSPSTDDTQPPTVSQDGTQADAPPVSDDTTDTEDTAETPRIFTDDAGRDVEISSEINRIVPSASLAQIVLLAIAPDMFVGLSSKLYDDSRDILPDYLFDLPVFGSLYGGADLNVEELALTAPDLIIDIGDSKGSVAEDMDTLQSQTQIPSVFLSATLETMPETYRTLGKLLGREERGEELAQFCEKIYNRTLSIMEQVGDNKIPCLYILGDEGLNVIAATSYHSELLDLLTNNLAVVDNPLSKGSGNEVTMEQIALWNPSFILFAPDSIYDTVSDNETWMQIEAILKNQYVKVPSIPHNWMSQPPSVQRYLGMIWLTAVLYPEYCDYDVKADIMEYYKLFYGCELTDEQYHTITAHAFLEN